MPNTLRTVAKRLPIVFCLDVSPSMTWAISEYDQTTPIALLNESVKNFIKDLEEIPLVRSSTELAFVTFSDTVESTAVFSSVGSYVNKPPVFVAKERTAGSFLGDAVIYSIDMLNKRMQELEKSPTYIPIMVIITDGVSRHDRPEAQAKAIETLNSYCRGGKVIPIIIGVGDRIDAHILNQYAKGAYDPSKTEVGYFPVKGKEAANKFKSAIKIITNVTHSSVNNNANPLNILIDMQIDYING